MTFHIHIQGLVQGVGFRPFVYQLAKANGYTGFVCNGTDGVHIEINATEEKALYFVEQINTHAPALAHITSCNLQQVKHALYSNFDITESDAKQQPDMPLTPDFAMCSQCRAELNNPGNRRYQYPFITCTQCGPRYSIIKQLPYDRAYTTMQAFTLCDACATEYNDVDDRRFFSQTNSCEKCGVVLRLYDKDKREICAGNNISLDLTVSKLQEGAIVAVKGIGGFLLMADATQRNVIATLRHRKHRPTKPFAVLFPTITDISKHAEVSDTAAQLLQSASAPIVLLPCKKPADELPLDTIAPQLDTLGAMLPNAPLLQIISQAFNAPLVATSANISGAAIIYTNEQALNELTDIADYILTHNRDILIPQDDSVLRIVEDNQGVTPIVIRKSRGLSPSVYNYTSPKDCAVLATGALVKSSFSICNNGTVYTSQFLGNTATLEAQQAYRHSLQHMLNVLQVQHTAVVTDKHKDYFSHEIAKEYTTELATRFVTVQHHKAHFSAVLAENNLLHSQFKILGVVWDGTGLGDDDTIWGGEFFIYENNKIDRYTQVSYFKHILADKFSREPRIAALSICSVIPEAKDLLVHQFSDSEWKIYNELLTYKDVLLSSSMGRVFDAVAALLGISSKQSYEGEAAILLETIAMQYVRDHGCDAMTPYKFFTEGTLNLSYLFSSIINDIKGGKTSGYVAARFHVSLVHCIGEVARHSGTQHIAFSGGVFQNALLVQLIRKYLSDSYTLFFHDALSPNDENISFGQLVYYCENIDGCGMLSSEQNVQECDATKADRNSTVDKQKIKSCV